jgi:hypothetical protein
MDFTSVGVGMWGALSGLDLDPVASCYTYGSEPCSFEGTGMF